MAKQKPKPKPKPKQTFWQKNKNTLIVSFIGVVVFQLIYFLITKPFNNDKKSDQITYNQQTYNNTLPNSNPTKYKVYFQNIQSLSSIDKTRTARYIFGNPENTPVNDVMFTIVNNQKFDTAYLERQLPSNNNGSVQFDNNNLRDAFCSLSPDKKTITFNASYVGAGQNINIIIVKTGGSDLKMNGVGKLF